MNRKSNTHKQPMRANNSPWTEVFQPETAPAAQPTPGSRAPQTPHAKSHAETEQPTHDALSAIFNHG